MIESSPTKVLPADAPGSPSLVQEKTAVKTTSTPEGAVVHVINGNSTQKKSPKVLKRAKTVEDIHILDASKEGNVGRFINVKGHKQKVFFCH